MPQKTNLNISPYYDDFDENKNFYRVLFKPGYPIQARELTTLQSSLQNQIESFGKNVFKEGSMVIPGSLNYDQFYYSVKINSQTQGIDVINYIDNLVGKKIKGQQSGVVALITNYALVSPQNKIDNLTLFVKYVESGINSDASTPFLDGENLLILESFVYGNTTIDVNQTVATLISSNATAVGSAVGITTGVYFTRGTFVNISSSIVILNPYNNTTSYRVGLNIIEEIVTSKEDESLLDNAKGFTNYSAPGADRLKISGVLAKKEITDFDDKSFVELLRIEEGAIKKLQATSEYSIVKDYFAKRTYEESGDYAIRPFKVEVADSLNDRVSNAGLFYENQKTSQGNTPSDDFMCINISPGKAYVKGYDIEKSGSSLIDVRKPRDSEELPSSFVPFEMGSVFKVNNAFGSPFIGINNSNNVVNLQNQRYSRTSVGSGAGTTIGQARLYSFSLENSPYISTSTSFNLYCFDVQTYTILTINQSITETDCPVSSYIRGVSSGASGYVVNGGGSGTTSLTLTQTSGTFIVGEQIYINESTNITRSVVFVKEYGIQDVKSVFQPRDNFVSVGIKTSFVADTLLSKVTPNKFKITDQINIDNNGIATCAGRSFVGIKSDAIIRYQRTGFATETYNRVVSVSSDGSTLKLIGVPTAFGVCEGGLPTALETKPFSLGIPIIESEKNIGLYAKLPNQNISFVNLSDSNLEIVGQFRQQSTSSTGSLSVSIPNLGISSAFFNTFDTQRYCVFYSDGSIENLTDDQFTISSNGSVASFSGLKPSQSSDVTVNVSVRKNLVTNKIKNYIRSEKVIVNKVISGVSTSISGLSTSPYYGLRISDNEISLNVPDVVKVVKVLESLNTDEPILDKLTFSFSLNLNSASILGEKVIGSNSKAVGQVVTRYSASQIEICYLNQNKFIPGESVTFEESNIISDIVSVSEGVYLDITNNFTLDKGQKDQYYDYSKIVRKNGSPSPSRQLLIIFDRYDVPFSDNGDVYTVNSYPAQRFKNDIPILSDGTRVSDTLDFRPRVSEFNPTNATKSPFYFGSRNFGDVSANTGIVVSPKESSVIGYSYYLPRIDKVVLNKDGNFNVILGTPSSDPKEPNDVSDSMTIGSISLPAYLYNPKNAKINLIDNRRYTMRDIGKLDNRISNLEKITSLSLLELDTKTLEIQDEDGFSRFKTGFFVDDFKNTDLIGGNKCEVANSELLTDTDIFTFTPEIGFASSIDIENADYNDDLPLLDPNVKKTGNLITLNYTEKVFKEQPLASTRENVNVFQIAEYTGKVELNPPTDTWIRTVPSGTVSERKLYGDTAATYTDKVISSTAQDEYIRSRNVSFFAAGLKAFTKYYAYFDNRTGIDIIPKLLEITMSKGQFKVGDVVEGYVSGESLPTIKFKLCAPNHKWGTSNNPTFKYVYSPYDNTYVIPLDYTQSSTLLNIDLLSLSQDAQGTYSGYVVPGMTLTNGAGAEAKVNSDIRLLSDGVGDLLGSFFFRNPEKNPPFKCTVGTKPFKLTSSESNEVQRPGELLITTAETTYSTSGFKNLQDEIKTSVSVPPPPPPPIIIQPIINPPPPPPIIIAPPPIINNYYPPPAPPPVPAPAPTERCGGKDPLAQTFTVDETGAFLTSIDLYFAKKDSTKPIWIEVRDVELGIPTSQLVQKDASIKIDPQDIKVSSDASPESKTNVKFRSPIYLEAGKEYAIVLLAPDSLEYQVWIGVMNQKTINTQYLPGAENLMVTKQYLGGSLFKSQNGTIWTPSQNEDLKFTLYKAQFVPSGTFYAFNPRFDNEYVNTDYTETTAITVLPRKLNIGITTSYVMDTILSSGRKVSDGSSYGYISRNGGPISSLTITNVGAGYSSGTFVGVPLYSITGNGSGATANIVFNGNGQINSVATGIGSTGSGYSVGDVLGITTSSVVKGRGGLITVGSIDGINTLYLTNVQGESFSVGSNLIYYNGSQTVSLANTTIKSSSQTETLYDGSTIEVFHGNHGMTANENRLEILNIKPQTVPVALTAAINSNSTTISVASTAEFTTFEGITTSRGYVQINNEIIYYNNIGVGNLSIGQRGIDSSKSRIHDINSLVYKYELNGVSLRRINTNFTMPNNSDLRSLRGIDNYHLKILRNDRATGYQQLSFIDQKTIVDETTRITNNVQFDTIKPEVNITIPSQSTSLVSQIRTTSATSSGGSEISFVPVDYEIVQPNQDNLLNSTRMICSRPNEINNLSGFKSFTISSNLSTTDPNLSPVINLEGSSIILKRNRLNRPISDYVFDGRVNSDYEDPHSSIYVSKKIDLIQASKSLQVLISAYRHASSDFRVFYKLYKLDSSEVSPSYTPFPGYRNLNDGTPDVFVRSSNDNEFLDYTFSADNLEKFNAFSIKIVMSGSNEARAPRFKDLRVIALER